MIYENVPIAGAMRLSLEKKSDDRGFLARWWDEADLTSHGIAFRPVEGYTCMTEKKGTLRGFHYISEPHKETKLTRIIRGSLFEVLVDLRSESPTYMKSFGTAIAASDYTMILTPPGCAHAVLTLEDNTEYISLYSPAYDPAIERGIRYNDPVFSVTWPIPITLVSKKDKSWPDYRKESR